MSSAARFRTRECLKGSVGSYPLFGAPLGHARLPGGSMETAAVNDRDRSAPRTEPDNLRTLVAMTDRSTPRAESALGASHGLRQD
jgi:hypothetical protein